MFAAFFLPTPVPLVQYAACLFPEAPRLSVVVGAKEEQNAPGRGKPKREGVATARAREYYYSAK